LQLADTGLVNYFSGIQKPLFQSHDMNAIFEGQIARQWWDRDLAVQNTIDLTILQVFLIRVNSGVTRFSLHLISGPGEKHSRLPRSIS